MRFCFPSRPTLFDGFVSDPDLAARALAAIIPLSLVAWLTWRTDIQTSALPAALLAIIVLTYLCSPTGYPWYATWFFMLLPLVPSIGAAIFTVTLPIYYLRYSLEAANQTAYFDQVLVPIEFGVPLLALAVEACLPNVARGRIAMS